MCTGCNAPTPTKYGFQLNNNFHALTPVLAGITQIHKSIVDCPCCFYMLATRVIGKLCHFSLSVVHLFSPSFTCHYFRWRCTVLYFQLHQTFYLCIVLRIVSMKELNFVVNHFFYNYSKIYYFETLAWGWLFLSNFPQISNIPASNNNPTSDVKLKRSKISSAKSFGRNSQYFSRRFYF